MKYITTLFIILISFSISAQKFTPVISGDSITMSYENKEATITDQVEILQIDTLLAYSISFDTVDSTGVILQDTLSVSEAYDTTVVQEFVSKKKLAKQEVRSWIADYKSKIKRRDKINKVDQKNADKLSKWLDKPKYENESGATEAEEVSNVDTFKSILKARGYKKASDITAAYKRSADIKQVASELGLDTNGSKAVVAQRIYDFING